MASTSNKRRPKRHIVAQTALVAFSLLLVLFGTVALGQLGKVAELNSLVVRLIGGASLPKADPVTSAARLGMLDATLVLLGSLVSLLYVSKRLSWVRNGALIVWLVAIGTSIFLAIQGSHTLVSNPARGDFAGLANLGTLIVHVIIPSKVALLTLIAFVCLIVLRPQSETRASFFRYWA
jgi:hypothetical protein